MVSPFHISIYAFQQFAFSNAFSTLLTQPLQSLKAPKCYPALFSASSLSSSCSDVELSLFIWNFVSHRAWSKRVTWNDSLLHCAESIGVCRPGPTDAGLCEGKGSQACPGEMRLFLLEAAAVASQPLRRLQRAPGQGGVPPGPAGSGGSRAL